MFIFSERNNDIIVREGYKETIPAGNDNETSHDVWQGIQGALLSAAATRSDGFPVEVIIGGNKRTFRFCRNKDITASNSKSFFVCDLMNQV